MSCDERFASSRNRNRSEPLARFAAQQGGVALPLGEHDHHQRRADADRLAGRQSGRVGDLPVRAGLAPDLDLRGARTRGSRAGADRRCARRRSAGRSRRAPPRSACPPGTAAPAPRPRGAPAGPAPCARPVEPHADALDAAEAHAVEVAGSGGAPDRAPCGSGRRCRAPRPRWRRADRPPGARGAPRGTASWSRSRIERLARVVDLGDLRRQPAAQPVAHRQPRGRGRRPRTRRPTSSRSTCELREQRRAALAPRSRSSSTSRRLRASCTRLTWPRTSPSGTASVGEQRAHELVRIARSRRSSHALPRGLGLASLGRELLLSLRDARLGLPSRRSPRGAAAVEQLVAPRRRCAVPRSGTAISSAARLHELLGRIGDPAGRKRACSAAACACSATRRRPSASWNRVVAGRSRRPPSPDGIAAAARLLGSASWRWASSAGTRRLMRARAAAARPSQSERLGVGAHVARGASIPRVEPIAIARQRVDAARGAAAGRPRRQRRRRRSTASSRSTAPARGAAMRRARRPRRGSLFRVASTRTRSRLIGRVEQQRLGRGGARSPSTRGRRRSAASCVGLAEPRWRWTLRAAPRPSPTLHGGQLGRRVAGEPRRMPGEERLAVRAPAARRAALARPRSPRARVPSPRASARSSAARASRARRPSRALAGTRDTRSANRPRDRHVASRRLDRPGRRRAPSAPRASASRETSSNRRGARPDRAPSAPRACSGSSTTSACASGPSRASRRRRLVEPHDPRSAPRPAPPPSCVLEAQQLEAGTGRPAARSSRASRASRLSCGLAGAASTSPRGRPSRRSAI